MGSSMIHSTKTRSTMIGPSTIGPSGIRTSRIGSGGNDRAAQPKDTGFSLIEVVISMAVLTVGMVSLLGVFGLAMASTQTSQQNLIAKQLADEAMESIITARNTTQISWSQIQNASSCSGNADPTSGGIFLPTTSTSPILYPIYNSGADGIYGTCDDTGSTPLLQFLADPGADGIYNTTDDTTIPLTNYQRTILIYPLYDANSNLIPTLRGVTITVQYSTPQNPQATYILNTYISQYP
jgi:prepilin-type N-terminal cleavage/methylation domain-containing protein